MELGETLIWKNPWCSPYIHGTFPTAKTCLWHPEDGTRLDQEDFGKGTSTPNLLVVGFTPPASFLTISPLEDVSTFNILLHRVWGLSRGRRGRRRNTKRQALDVRTGTCHSNFQSGRRIKQRLSLPPGTRVGPEANQQFCGRLPKKRVDKWSSGNFNSQTCRIINYNYRPKGYWGKARKRIGKQGRIAGNRFQEVDSTRLESTWIAEKRRQWCTWPKRAYAFFPEYIQEKTHTPFLDNQASRKCKSTLQRSLTSHRSKGPCWKKCKTQKCRTGHGEIGASLCWWAGCKLPTATLEKCTLCHETSKKHSLESIGHFHSWAYKLGKVKINKIQAPQSLGLLCLQEPPIRYTLNISGKRKMDTEVVVLMYNGISLSYEINVIRLIAAWWLALGTMILSEISHTEKDTYHKISLIEGM